MNNQNENRLIDTENKLVIARWKQATEKAKSLGLREGSHSKLICVTETWKASEFLCL